MEFIRGLCEARSSYLAWIFSCQDERVARFTRPLFVRRGTRNSAGEEFLIARLIASVNSFPSDRTSVRKELAEDARIRIPSN